MADMVRNVLWERQGKRRAHLCGPKVGATRQWKFSQKTELTNRSATGHRRVGENGRAHVFARIPRGARQMLDKSPLGVDSDIVAPRLNVKRSSEGRARMVEGCSGSCSGRSRSKGSAFWTLLWAPETALSLWTLGKGGQDSPPRKGPTNVMSFNAQGGPGHSKRDRP